ncbi:MAG: hypothetical protein COV59_03735 [Candidatus Magasanikbacteria bacterium CG11_big_fil_rev_8_21_14_0_20_39_34]|uniref:Methyltransferase FkbM domain-containing protein n=1 Tax=Candidatus Magasanikbacteria bacterium CG11_big_fil_rev_8_21_14_0_20_39_34 TaxID=1974653 RepID=A0A2H0N4F6_9BACT|nr:MAG: hypothetical protein COV59_03735 [Candidatus Magasanikbacteria bacterium CG11_big_fil_rev_8_21_14_0_20_39_34]
MIQKIVRWFKKLLNISQLGATPYFKCKLFFCYFALFLRRKITKKVRLEHFVRFQLRFEGKVFSFFVRNQLDFDLLKDTFIDGEYDFPFEIKPKVIFDMGSNIGATVIYFKLKYPEAKIFAFEPDPRNACSIHLNIEQFGSDVVLYNQAVYSKDNERIKFYSCEDLHWSSSIIQRKYVGDFVEVSTITVDKVIEDHNLDRVDIVKFDIEGAEYEVFEKIKNLNKLCYLTGEVHRDLVENKTLQDFYDILKERFEKIKVKENHNRAVVMFKNRTM